MKYTVVWRPAAQQALARLWTAGPDRADIAAASNAIDRALKYDPSTKGEPAGCSSASRLQSTSKCKKTIA